MIQGTTYHKVLRTSAVVLALVLLFESGLLVESTATISQTTHQYLANAVGATASVAPNELNTLTAELTAQKKALEEREAALREREIAVNLGTGATDNERNTYIIAALLFIILTLIVLNYTLDYLRIRELEKRFSNAQPV